MKITGLITVNQQTREWWKPLEEGDLVTVTFPKEDRGEKIKPEDGPLTIVYEDEDVLILDKPAGITVLPSIDGSQPSIANRLLYYYDEHDIPSTVHIVTRLDRHTSGLMLVAKHAYSHMLLTKKAKLVERFYKAIVNGQVKEEKGMIDEPIAREEGSIIKRAVSRDGKPSQTIYKVEEHYPSHTLVELQLMTGRTHQIRVHMSHAGYPLAGDTLYGGKKSDCLQGQALHCYKLRFDHPWTKETMEFNSDVPDVWEEMKKSDPE